jgi:hypothetical protein
MTFGLARLFAKVMVTEPVGMPSPGKTGVTLIVKPGEGLPLLGGESAVKLIFVSALPTTIAVFPDAIRWAFADSVMTAEN